MIRVIQTLLLLACTISVFSQSTEITPWASSQEPAQQKRRVIVPNIYRTVKLDESDLRSFLANVPQEFSGTAQSEWPVIDLNEEVEAVDIAVWDEITIDWQRARVACRDADPGLVFKGPVFDEQRTRSVVDRNAYPRIMQIEPHWKSQPNEGVGGRRELRLWILGSE